MWILIRNDLLRHAVVWENLLHIDCSNSCGVDIFAAWEEKGSLRAIMIHDCQHGVEIPTFG
jgi:hypothetical protein